MYVDGSAICRATLSQPATPLLCGTGGGGTPWELPREENECHDRKSDSNQSQPPSGRPLHSRQNRGQPRARNLARRGQRILSLPFTLMKNRPLVPTSPHRSPCLRIRPPCSSHHERHPRLMRQPKSISKTAGIILYGLQLASTNMARVRELFPPAPEEDEESNCPPWRKSSSTGSASAEPLRIRASQLRSTHRYTSHEWRINSGLFPTFV